MGLKDQRKVTNQALGRAGTERPVGSEIAMNIGNSAHLAAAVAPRRAVENLWVAVTSVSLQPGSEGGPGTLVVGKASI